MPPFTIFGFHRVRLTLAGTFLALTGLSFAQSPQVLIYDGGHNDSAYAVTTDPSGSIVVGGYSNVDSTPASFAVLKYSAAGSLRWLARPQGFGDYIANTATDVATDSVGNVYAVGYANKPLPFLQNELGWLVASFDSNGVQRWTQLFNGAGTSFDIARKVAVDSQGVYVTGITADGFGHSDWLTIKYSLAGVEQWRRIESGAGNTDDQPVALKLDGAGNLVVLGFIQPVNISGPKDVRVVKFNVQGTVLWRADYSGTSVSDESPSDLALDANGNIYVTADRGISTNPELSSTPITIKFDASGNRLFVLEGPGRGGSAVAVDQTGNFIVSGVSFGDAGSNPIPATSKFTPNGTLLWSLPFSGLNLSVDPLDGSAYLTRGLSGFSVVKVSSSGQILWEQTIPQSKTAIGALVDDATGAFIVAGNSDSGNGNINTARFAVGSVPPPPPPPVPAAPSGMSASAKKGAITVNWSDNSNNETGFLVERSDAGGAFAQIALVGANVRTFNDTGLVKGKTYGYHVRAFNSNGNSAYSNTATATPK